MSAISIDFTLTSKNWTLQTWLIKTHQQSVPPYCHMHQLPTSSRHLIPHRDPAGPTWWQQCTSLEKLMYVLSLGVITLKTSPSFNNFAEVDFQVIWKYHSHSSWQYPLNLLAWNCHLAVPRSARECLQRGRKGQVRNLETFIWSIKFL